MKKEIGKFLEKQKEENVSNDYYQAKLFGEAKSVEYSIDGLCKSYCKLTEWSNGEGYDINFQSEYVKGKFEDKSISLHTDEIDVLLASLNHFKYFGKLRIKKDK